jgi:hypothetical protein
LNNQQRKTAVLNHFSNKKQTMKKEIKKISKEEMSKVKGGLKIGMVICKPSSPRP